MNVYLIAHMPKQNDGKRAKSGRGTAAQVQLAARTEDRARESFADLYPDREITAVGVQES